MKTFYLAFLAIFFLSCNDNDDNTNKCIEFDTAGIETVTPAAVVDATGHYFDVGFRVINGCGQFEEFEQTTEGTVTTIGVIAKYEGCICTQDTPLRQTVYHFTQTIPGVYTLNFKMQDGTFITQTVVVGNSLQ